MDLRDHLFAKAPYLIGDQAVPDHSDVDVLALAAGNGHHVPESGFARVLGCGPEQAVRPLVGSAEVGGVIDPDVLWSCTTCGACVEQCPVDIEHVDHIVDMRRYQVLIEAEFPTELGTVPQSGEQGQPVGTEPVRPDGLGEGPGLRRPAVDRRDVARGRGVPLLDRLRWRL